MKSELIYGIGIFIPVSDLERSTRWYSSMLGFEVIHRDEPNATVIKMGNGTVLFCLVKSSDIKPLVFPKNDYGVNVYHNFHTSNVEEVHKWFYDKGVQVSDIHQFDGMRGFDLYDPDGNQFGVVQ